MSRVLARLIPTRIPTRMFTQPGLLRLLDQRLLNRLILIQPGRWLLIQLLDRPPRSGPLLVRVPTDPSVGRHSVATPAALKRTGPPRVSWGTLMSHPSCTQLR